MLTPLKTGPSQCFPTKWIYWAVLTWCSQRHVSNLIICTHWCICTNSRLYLFWIWFPLGSGASLILHQTKLCTKHNRKNKVLSMYGYSIVHLCRGKENQSDLIANVVLGNQDLFGFVTVGNSDKRPFSFSSAINTWSINDFQWIFVFLNVICFICDMI